MANTIQLFSLRRSARRHDCAYKTIFKVIQNQFNQLNPNYILFTGNRTTPSYVAFTDSERLIGDAAKNQVAVNPKNTIFDAKRLIGRKFTDEPVQKDMKQWPFKVISDAGKPKLQVEYQTVFDTGLSVTPFMGHLGCLASHWSVPVLFILQTPYK